MIPDGLLPIKYHEQNRMCEIEKAIMEYTAVKQMIPAEWIIELADLIQRQDKHEVNGKVVQFQFWREE